SHCSATTLHLPSFPTRRSSDLPYTMSGGQSFFDRAEIKDIISYLRLIANAEDDPAFIRAVTTPKRGVGQSTLATLGEFAGQWQRSEEHTSELQSRGHLVCRLLL